MFLENCSVIDKKELGIQKQKLFHCITKDGRSWSILRMKKKRPQKGDDENDAMYKKAIISLFDKLTF